VSFHEPVLVREVVSGLVVDPGGTYVDATAGGGGHGQAILEALNADGFLVALDRDQEAVAAARERLSCFGARVEVVRAEFSELVRVLEDRALKKVSGVLFDIGVSSHQLDAAGRGFSYRQDGPIDMRMDARAGSSALDLINSCSEEELAQTIRQFGEERQAGRIARAIRRRCNRDRLCSTGDLRAAIVETGPRHPAKTLARVFQALRIAVNDELGQLQQGLDAAVQSVASGGRVGIISYHSLEDRLVKHAFADQLRGCICPSDLPVCACGREPTFRKAVARVRAGTDEVASNPRSRSATLRIFERL